MAQKTYKYPEFAGALQQKTNPHIKKPNEIRDGGNIDFGAQIGSMRRRLGSQHDDGDYDLPELPVDNNTLGAYIARFPAGNEVWAVNNAADDLTAVLKRWTGPAATDWTNIRTGMLADAQVYMQDDLDEVVVSSYHSASDTVGDPFVVDSTHNVSTTRHLQFGPKARFYIPFAGAMWAWNVTVGGVRMRDRGYKSSGPTGAISFARSPQTITQTAANPTAYATPFAADSVRYIKATMDVDIYDAGTSTLLYQLTVNSVDTAEDTIDFGTPNTVTFPFSDVDGAGDFITVPSNTWMQTGTPVTFWQGTGLPTGLTQGGIYYVIRLTSTAVKLATTRPNALAGTAVDIVSQGTGTHRLTFTLVVGNKDEIWGRDRKGKLTRYWNTDYRNPENADWIKIPATFDAGNDITGVGTLTGRCFVFTENAMCRLAGTQTGQNPNLITLRNDVGCISHRTICYYDSFMIWLDAKAQVWVRNEEAGTMDIISEPIDGILSLVPKANLPDASAVCVGKNYKLYLGTVDGRTLRVVYNFRTNQWSKEWFTPKMPVQLEYKYAGVVKPHWFDEHGKMWVDEEGNTDNGSVIPFDPELGDDDFGMDAQKRYMGIKVWAHNVAGTKVMASFDSGQFKDVAELSKPVQSVAIRMPLEQPKATTINVKFVNSSSGEPVQIDKATVYYNEEEDTFVESK